MQILLVMFVRKITVVTHYSILEINGSTTS